MTNLEKNSDNHWLGKMLLGIVGNVALQATQKHLTKENLFETSIVGALAGLAGNAIGRNVSDGEGFGSGTAAGSTAATILSLGNAIINKKNDFANDFATIGTLALVDGVVKEIAKNELENEKEPKWKTKYDFHLPSGELLPVKLQKSSQVGCTQKVLESIAEYMRVTIPPLNYDDGMDFRMLAQGCGFWVKEFNPINQNVDAESDKEYNIMDIARYLHYGYPIAITYGQGRNAHTVGVSRIECQYNTKNPQKNRYIFWIMDPLRGTIRLTMKKLLCRAVRVVLGQVLYA